MIGGSAYPVFTIFMAQLVNAIFSLSSNDPNIVSSARADANRNCLIITLLGVAAFFANLFEMLFFCQVG